MSNYLITRWFGTFLFENDSIKEKRLFPNDTVLLEPYILSLIDQKILKEEEVLLSTNDIIVSEKRFINKGFYQPNNSFFHSINIQPESFGYTEQTLRDCLLQITKNKVSAALESPDFQVIQMVNAVDDLIQTANLLSERLASWNIFPMTDDITAPFENVLRSVRLEISRLESEIQKQMMVLTPNINSLIGPLLAARILSSAGSLKKLGKLPSSSIQLLGAEKALFRFKKEGGRPPKHGIIFQHSLINKAPKRLRGKYARALSSQISLAAKADVFTRNDISKELIECLEKKVIEIKKSANV